MCSFRMIGDTRIECRDASSLGISLSQAAQGRLRWMQFYHTHRRNAALTCRRLGIGRQTFYRWKRRLDPQNLASLEGCSHRPQPTWTPELVKQMLTLPLQFLRWGKDKLVVLLRRERRSNSSPIGNLIERSPGVTNHVDEYTSYLTAML